MPAANPPLYPYGNTGILWLDALLKGMHKDPFSIMPGQLGGVLGKGVYANEWRDIVAPREWAPGQGLTDLLLHTNPGAPRTAEEMPKAFPTKDWVNALSAMLGGRGGGGTFHPGSQAPEALEQGMLSPEDLANSLVNHMLNLYADTKGVGRAIDQMLRPFRLNP